MLSFNVNGREVRSFRLRFITNKFYSFFVNKESSGVFMSCASVRPEERALLRGDFAKNNLEFIFVGKNVSRFLFSSKKLKHIKNLLRGGVVLVRDCSKNCLSIENMKFAITQQKFYFRFFFSKLSFYRHNKIRKLFNISMKKKKEGFFFFFKSFFCKLPLGFSLKNA